jgi:N-acetyl-gamma-glutamylphosphate reductase
MERPCLSTCHNKHFVSETLMKVYKVAVYPKTKELILINFIKINISSVQSVVYLISS